VLLGNRITDGAEPPDQLVRDVLYEQRLHSVNSEPGDGKTLFALWASLGVMRQDRPVLYLDAENGVALIAERLEDMGADPAELDRLLHYYPSPEITPHAGSRAALQATAEDIKPTLVVFDAWPDFLALAGLNENDAGDVTRWTLDVAQPLKEAGCAVLLLDHLTKSAEGRGRYARGSGAKLAKMDVAWSLSQTQPFDRERVGEITLTLRKDREAYLPAKQKFEAGGSLADGGLLFRRADGVIEEPNLTNGLTDKQHQALAFLDRRGKQGASWTELLNELGGSKGTLSRTLRVLFRRNLVTKPGNSYLLASPAGTRKP
jgi:hypothetical protein